MKKNALVAALSALQLKSEKVELPGISEPAYVRELTVAERIEMIDRVTAGKGDGQKSAEAQAWIIFRTLESEPGTRAFDGLKFEDVAEQIALIPADVQNAICLATQKASGLLQEQSETEKN